MTENLDDLEKYVMDKYSNHLQKDNNDLAQQLKPIVNKIRQLKDEEPQFDLK